MSGDVFRVLNHKCFNRQRLRFAVQAGGKMSADWNVSEQVESGMDLINKKKCGVSVTLLAVLKPEAKTIMTV